MDALHEPESLRDRPEVEFIEMTETLPAPDFEAARERIESHAVVGITNTDGEVLLMNDGDHGWTLTAFPVEDGDEWTAVARLGTERVTGQKLPLEDVLRVRRVEFRQEGPAEARFTMENVVFRSSPVAGRPIAEAFEGPGEEAWDLEWFDTVPEGVDSGLAEDIRLFVE